MAKKKEAVDYSNPNKNPYIKSRRKPFIAKLSRNIGIFSFVFFTLYMYYQVNNSEAERSALGFFGNFIFLIYFMLNARTVLLKSVISRFLIPGIVTAFYTFNLCGLFDVHYPVFYDMLKDSLFFCYGLPIVMMFVSTKIPLNTKVRFNLGTGIGAMGLVVFSLIQTWIEHHNLFIFSVERMHTALTYSWFAVVLGIIFVLNSKFDVNYYAAYLEYIRPKPAGPGSYSSVENANGDSVDSYYFNRATPKMQQDWLDGRYRNPEEFKDDYNETDGYGSKS